MAYRSHQPPAFLLIGYDPLRDLAGDHLARLVEAVVEETLAKKPKSLKSGPGQPAYDPRLLCKVLIFGYATGVRASRQLERHCRESLPYLLLVRDDRPSYRTLCTFRVDHSDLIEEVFLGLFAVARAAGVKRMGRIVVDSSKLKADAGPEAVLKKEEYADVLAELKRILEEAEAADEKDEQDPPGTTNLGVEVPIDQMRDILRRVRKERGKRTAAVATEQTTPTQVQPGAGSQAPEENTAPQVATVAIEPAGPAAPAQPKASNAILDLDPPAQAAAASTPDAKPEGRSGPAKRPGPDMFKVVKFTIAAIETAIERGLKHLCVTDPDARMMGEGRSKQIRECYSFEAAVDNGLLVVGQITQDGNDNARLETIVDAAKALEPDGVKAVDGDSGYYRGDAIANLIAAGIDVCVPDSNTACDIRREEPIGSSRGRRGGKVALTYDAQADQFVCPENKRLVFSQNRTERDQPVKVYRAETDCSGCPLAKECLTQKNAKRRTVHVLEENEILATARQRFEDPAIQERYHHRADQIETVFAFIRTTLGFTRFVVRGADRVASEATLIKTAFQFRKIQSQLNAIGQAA